jgi:N-acetylmuramoyl-L-alanine amidase
MKMTRRIQNALVMSLLGVLSACSSLSSGPHVSDTTKSFSTVVVDAGHGGKDNGAYRQYGGAEKTATLDVAKRLQQKLRESQIKTVMTRSTDVFIELDDRVRIGNAQKNSVFVSIHFNDSRKRGIHGFETYYHSTASRDLAGRIQTKLLTIPHSMNRGVKTANFRAEGDNARDSEYRELLADRIAEAIVETRYGGGVYHVAEQPLADQTDSASGVARRKFKLF